MNLAVTSNDKIKSLGAHISGLRRQLPLAVLISLLITVFWAIFITWSWSSIRFLAYELWILLRQF
jgi:hypothetical protein